jgi:hypothetical protein
MGKKLKSLKPIPKGFKLIPGLSEEKYFMNTEGAVWNRFTDYIVKPLVYKKRYGYYNFWCNRRTKKELISDVYKRVFDDVIGREKFFKLTGIELLVRRPKKNKKEEEAELGSEFPLNPKRKCHDCDNLTWRYRCLKCFRKWREKHNVDRDAYYNE